MMVTDLKCWWQNHYVGEFLNVLNRSSTSQTCHQHIWSPKSVTYIYVTVSSKMISVPMQVSAIKSNQSPLKFIFFHKIHFSPIYYNFAKILKYIVNLSEFTLIFEAFMLDLENAKLKRGLTYLIRYKMVYQSC